MPDKTCVIGECKDQVAVDQVERSLELYSKREKLFAVESFVACVSPEQAPPSVIENNAFRDGQVFNLAIYVRGQAIYTSQPLCQFITFILAKWNTV